MFTLRFMSFFQNENEDVSVVISANHYEVYTYSNGRKTVCVYNDHTSTEGIERNILSDELAKKLLADENIKQHRDYFHVCYVENSSGKTIDKIKTK